MQITLPHQISYDFDGKATVEEIAKSLVANERLTRDAIAIFAGCFPGLVVEDTKIQFVSVSQESPLKEILAAAVILAFQEDLEQEVPDLIQKMIGLNIPDQYDTLVTVFVMIAAIYGASYLHNRFSRKDTNSAKALPREYDRLIKVAGDYIHVPEAVVKESVDRHLGKGRRQVVAKAARDFFAPAQRHNARSINSGGSLHIPKDAIDEVPTDVDIESFEPEQDSYLLENAEVVFQAHDINRQKKGWAAIVPQVSRNRKPLHIDPSVDIEGLFTKRKVLANVIVFAKQTEKEDYEPQLYYLQSIADLDPEANDQ